jgi:DNA-binding PadR family transcriptional regulator
MLALRPTWSTWELTTQLRRNMRFFWPRAESRIYDEARALVDRGLATSSVSYVGRRQRTSYRITAAGRRQLRAWVAAPPRPTTLECEPVLRLLLGRLSTQEQLHAAVAQVRADGEAILDVGRTVAAEYAAGTAPFQGDVAYRSLVFDFLSNHALMLIAWADRADAALDAMTGHDDGDNRTTAIDRVARIRASYPD